MKEVSTALCNSVHRNSQSCSKYSLNTTGELTHAESELMQNLETACCRNIHDLDSVSCVVAAVSYITKEPM